MQWPDHLLSLEEWDALPEDNTRHYELWEGRLEVGPRPLPDHQRVMSRLLRQFGNQLTAEFEPLTETEVALFGTWPPTVRVPDLMVVPEAVACGSPRRYQAADVLLTVEIVSPGSRKTDRLVKLSEYAEAGIPRYWIIDLGDQVTLAAYELVEGEYKLVAEGSETLRLQAPDEVVINVAALR